jgi:gamma-glutamylcyclotransferase (GGCT)/AIG2-like uncharacterized protein YtfP
MTEGPRGLFVYGTLRRGAGRPMHALLATHAEYRGLGWVAGRLYDTGRYPAAVPAARPGERIRGEMYRLREASADSLLARLDAYEGCDPEDPGTSLFRREAVQVTLDAGGRAEAWIYLFNRPVARLRHIESGDYADGEGG